MWHFKGDELATTKDHATHLELEQDDANNRIDQLEGSWNAMSVKYNCRWPELESVHKLIITGNLKVVMN